MVARRAVFRVAVLSVTFAASLSWCATSPASGALSLASWANGYLSFIGSPAENPDSARIVFLEKWAMVEGTFYLGNIYNPLDTELDEPGAGLWNEAGVRTFPTLEEGYEASLQTMEQSIDAPILHALRSRRSTVGALTTALSESDWTGYGPRSVDERGYAADVRRGPVGPAGSLGPDATANGINLPPPGPEATITGRVVTSYEQGARDVCVSAVPDSGLAVTAITDADGSFDLDELPLGTYRLRVTDCDFTQGGLAPVYFAADAVDRSTTSAGGATVLRLSCPHGCGGRTDRIGGPLVYGSTTPTVTWPTPASITYGTPLSASQLDPVADVAGTFAFTPPAGTVLPAGDQTVTTTFMPRAGTAFRTITSTVAVTVVPAVPVVQWAPPPAMVYGTELSGADLDATASVPGSFDYAGNPAGSTPVVGTTSLRAVFEPTDSRDYTSVPVSVPITVQAAEPGVTVQAVPSAPAGSTLTRSDLNVASSVPGTFAFAPSLGSVLPAGPQVVLIGFTPTDTTDYSSEIESVTIDGTQSVPQLTWAAPAAVPAGTELSGSQLDARSSVPGTFSYSPPSGTVLPPGSDTVTVTFVPTNTTAYTDATLTTTILVQPSGNAATSESAAVSD